MTCRLPALLFSVLSQLCLAQPLTYFRNLTTSDGLTNDQVVSIGQDSKGLIWVGTQDGLNRFDGLSFSQFFNSPGDDQSLGSNDISNYITEDKHGRLWIGLDGEGFTRYDPRTERFTNFTHANGQLAEKKFDGVINFTFTDDGNTYVNTHRGLLRVTPEDRIEIILEWDSAGTYPFSVLRTGHLENKRWLWIGSNHGFIRYDTQTESVEYARYNPNQIKLLSVPGSISGICLAAGKIWYSTWEPPRGSSTRFLYSFDIAKNQIDSVAIAPGPRGNHYADLIHEILVDRHGMIWLGTSSIGLLRFDPAQKSWYPFIHDSEWDGSILPGSIRTLFEDRNGNLWVGTDNGMSILAPERQFFSNYLWTPGHPAVKLDNLESMYVSGGDVWVQQRQTGLTQLDGNLVVKQSGIRMREGRPGYETNFNTVLVTERYHYFSVWFMGLVRVDRVTGKITRYADFPDVDGLEFRDVFVDRQGTIWTWAWGRFGKLDPETGTYESVEMPPEIWSGRPGLVWSVAEDADGLLWLGTNGCGLLCFDPKQMKIIRQLTKQTHSLPAVTVYKVLFDDGKLYLSLDKAGLGILDVKTDSLVLYSKLDGICSNNINDLVLDSDGELWLGSSSGISWFDQNQKRFRTFTTDDGMLSNDVSRMGRLPDGTIVMNVGSGLVTFDPAKLKRTSPALHPTIKSLQVYDQQVNLSEWQRDSSTVRVAWNNNYLRAEFSALEFFDPDKIRFAYRLEGAEPDWNYTDHRPVAVYTGLRGGHYTLAVKCTNIDGEWGPELRIPVFVTTPFFRQLWFFALAGIVLAAILYALYRIRIRRLKAVYALRNRISRDLHDDIGSGLSGIRMLSAAIKKGGGKVKPSEAAEKIEETSKEIMEKMSDIVWVISPRHDTAEELVARMRLAATELLDPKGIELRFTETADDKARLPMEVRRSAFLILKEAVNNICKYSGATNAHITIRQSARKFEMTIQDDGKGFDVHRDTAGNGLRNMRGRAEEIKGALDITSSQDKGTRVHLSVTY